MKLNIVPLLLAKLLWNWQKSSIGSVPMCGTPTWCTREQMKSTALAERVPELPTVQAQTCALHQVLRLFACSGKLVHVLDLAWTALHPTMALIYWLRRGRRYSCNASPETPQ